MGKLIRCITSNGQVMATAVDTTDIVARAEGIHTTSAVVTAALGRLLTAASMMGNMLKGRDNSITLRINGNGPAGSLIAVADFNGDRFVTDFAAFGNIRYGLVIFINTVKTVVNKAEKLKVSRS